MLRNCKKVFVFFSSLKRPAVIESGKIMFALIGVGSVMANIVVAGRWFFIPVVLLFLGTWYALYCQMEDVQ